MRRKHLIFASCIISALLLTFTFHVSADENVTADAGASSNSAPLLDSYFWTNYDLLPYLEATSTQQYIDTGIKQKSSLISNLRFSGVVPVTGTKALFGSSDDGQNMYIAFVYFDTDKLNFRFSSGVYNYDFDPSFYEVYDIKFGQDVYVNNTLVHSFDNTFTGNSNIYIFGRNDGGFGASMKYKLYNFSIYDTTLDTNDNEIGYVRYYYPAKAKSSGVIGLYDAVSKTFVTTGGSVPFESPTDDKVIHFQIGDFITSGLGWIGDILDFAIEEPMILMFMAIGLCGVAFRWARRVVHF